MLALAALALDGMAAEGEDEIVAVGTVQGVTHDAVFGAVALDNLKEGAPLAMGDVFDGHLFAVAGDALVIMLEDGGEFADKGIATLVDAFALEGHLFLPEADDLRIGLGLLLEHGVALLQSLVVAVDGLHVGVVVLRDDHVHEAAALLAATVDEEGVGGGDHDQGDESDVLRETAVLLFVAPEVLLRAALHAAGDGDFAIIPFEHQEVLAVADDGGVDGIGSGVAEGEEIDGIEDVGLADAVAADHAVDLRREVERGLPDVLIVDERQFL